MSEKRYRIFRRKKDLDELPVDSSDVFQRNMLDRYIDRPDLIFHNGKFTAMDLLCLAEL